MADDSDIPPLEDMSDLIKQAQAIREKQDKQQRPKQQNGHAPPDSIPNTPKVSNITDTASDTSPSQKPAAAKPKQTQTKSETSTGFGGFKKGFLFGGSSSKPKQVNSPKQGSTNSKPGAVQENIPFIKKKEDTEKESLKMPEVQKNMSSMEQMTKNTDWVSDELLNKIDSNKDLMRKLGQKKYMDAVNMFQSNPVAAMEKYKDDSEVRDFLTQFCGIMGEHFSGLADKQEKQTTPKPAQNQKIQEIDDDTTMTLKENARQNTSVNSSTKNSADVIHTRSPTGGADMSVRSSTNPKQATADDERKMKEILENSEVRDILMDSKIQELFSALRTDPEKGQRLLANADGGMRMKINKLVQCGLLQFQS